MGIDDLVNQGKEFLDQNKDKINDEPEHAGRSSGPGCLASLTTKGDVHARRRITCISSDATSPARTHGARRRVAPTWGGGAHAVCVGGGGWPPRSTSSHFETGFHPALEPLAPDGEGLDVWCTNRAVTDAAALLHGTAGVAT